MLEVIIGQQSNILDVRPLREKLRELNPTGTLYFSYPILATATESERIEALLTCEEYGVVVFDLQSAASGKTAQTVEERQEDLHAALYQKLISHKSLRQGRGLSFDVTVISVVPTADQAASLRPLLTSALVASPDELDIVLSRLSGIPKETLKNVNAAIQRMSNIKPSDKRIGVQKIGSRAAKMKRIEAEIANLDQWQKKAAIETPEGPQRVRGLAGSGKTIVLALKAAYLHTQHPNWNIIVTYNTRALRAQLTDLIRRFCFEHINDEPDWTKLKVQHSWGSSRSVGTYFEIATENELPALDFVSAKNSFGYDDAFAGACDSLLTQLKEKKNKRPLYDAVLIDEAQDLPREFFELCYLATRDPKRIVYAYDELQNLNAQAVTVPAPDELFGRDESGRPNVANLRSSGDEPARDIMLPVCYRNTPYALTTAHALGFGIYRTKLVQYFDDDRLWKEIGYEVVSGELEMGKRVSLKRRSDSYPEYFTSLISADDAVVMRRFDSRQEQADFLAEQIQTDFTEDELNFRDVLVILSNPLTAREEASVVVDALNNIGIPSHHAGVTASVDKLFEDDSVAISGIYRAKGNEAPIVYIVNAEYFVHGNGTIAVRRRNMLFTAITRSRGWVRIFGVGEAMDQLISEFESVKSRGFQLEFTVPDEAERAQLRRIQRGVTKEDSTLINKANNDLRELLEKIESGELDRSDLPKDFVQNLVRLRGS